LDKISPAKWLTVLLFLPLFWTCRVDETATIRIGPERIVAGIGDVLLRVYGENLPSKAIIRVGTAIYTPDRSVKDCLSCTLPREATLPTDLGAASHTLTVDLVSPIGEVLSNSAQLTILRDYEWQEAAKISDLTPARLMSLSQSPEGLIQLVFRTPLDIYRIQSSDKGQTWSAPHKLFTVHEDNPMAPPTLLTVRDLSLLMVKTTADLTIHEVRADNTVLAGRRIPGTEKAYSYQARFDDIGNLHLAWNFDSDVSDRQVYHSRSSDLGVNWSPPLPVLGADALDQYGWVDQLAAQSEEQIWVTYSFYYGRYEQAHNHHSSDAGKTWSASQNTRKGAMLFPESGKILKYGKVMNLPYQYNPFIELSQDGSETWQTAFYSENEAHDVINWLAAAPNSSLLACMGSSYMDRKFMMRSFDGGSNWVITDNQDDRLPAGDALSMGIMLTSGEVLLISGGGYEGPAGIWLNRPRTF
jgi:hypothetical protein